MEKMTVEDLINLKYGDKATYIYGNIHREYRFIGIHPTLPHYYIFAEGSQARVVYFNKMHNELPGGIWLKGEYDSKTIGQLLINYHKSCIRSIKKVYLKEG